MAVVVQKLVPADAAGVMFTANPLNGQLDQVVINAAWGLGEAIVSGRVTPDTYVTVKSSGRSVNRQIAEKKIMTVRMESGTQEQPVSAARKNKPVLSIVQIVELVGLGK